MSASSASAVFTSGTGSNATEIVATTTDAASSATIVSEDFVVTTYRGYAVSITLNMWDYSARLIFISSL